MLSYLLTAFPKGRVFGVVIVGGWSWPGFAMLLMQYRMYMSAVSEEASRFSKFCSIRPHELGSFAGKVLW